MVAVRKTFYLLLITILNMFNEWLIIANEDLNAAEVLYLQQKYRQAIFFLQQVDEKIGKGILTSLRLMIENNKEFNPIFKLNNIDLHFLQTWHIRPKTYGHNWHKEMLKRMKQSIILLKKIDITRLFIKNELTEEFNTYTQWRNYLLESEQIVDKVKIVEPNPSIEQIVHTVTECNQRLDTLQSLQNEDWEIKYYPLIEKFKRKIKEKLTITDIEDLENTTKMELSELCEKTLSSMYRIKQTNNTFTCFN